ncbi:MAG: PIG-L family deacetylase [Victivallaceae bacterium]|jgi:LmbE family N-acetylglucosaminyl deacetylase
MSFFWPDNVTFPVSLDALAVPSGLRLLALAPHPDDFDAIAVTMKRFFAAGTEVFVAVASSGASGVEDAFCTLPTNREKALTRETEQRRSCGFFGLPDDHVRFLRLEEDETGTVMDKESNFAAVAAVFKELSPSLVFLPHGNDTNADHRLIYAMLSRLGGNADHCFTAFLNRDPKTIALRMDVYTAFGEADAAWKAELLRFHQSQHQRNLNTRGYGFDERILAGNRDNAKLYGIQNRAYAEIFELQFFPR